MISKILKMNSYKKINYAVMLELLLCFLLDLVLNKNKFVICAIILDVAIIVGIYIFYNDYLIIGLTFLSAFTLIFLIENVGLPSFFIYIQDIFILMMALKLVIYYVTNKSKIHSIYYVILAFLVLSFFSFILNHEDTISYFKGLYLDYLRYFILAAYIINIHMPLEKILKFIKLLWNLLLIQIPFIVIEYFWDLKYWKPKIEVDVMQDYLCGILGARSTTELGLYITIGLNALFILYINKKIKFNYFIIIAILLVSIAVLAEVKFIFILLPATFFIVLVTKFNIKSISVFLSILVILGVGLIGLQKIYPIFDNFFSVDQIEKYSDSTYAESGIGRSNSYIIANKAISDSKLNLLLGYGAGSADKIFHGIQFSAFNISQYIVECGYLGVSLLYGIYLYMIYVSWWLMKFGRNKFASILGQLGIISMISIIISTVNNRSMVQINFSIFSWALIGLIYKYYYLCRDKEEDNTLKF